MDGGLDTDMAREGEGSGEGRPRELLTGSKSRHSGPSWQRAKRNSNVTRLPPRGRGSHRPRGHPQSEVTVSMGEKPFQNLP